MRNKYNEIGFIVIRQLFENKELEKLESLLTKFHELWIKDNAEFYNSEAVNSAYLTGKKYLDNNERNALFHFIACQKVIDVLAEVIPSTPCFMNTQLFFDPVNEKQKNCWHRDIQYLDISEEQQQVLLLKENMNVTHFRVPLKKENGVELVPETNHRWDNDIEYEVRKELNGRKCFNNLPTGKQIALDRGDMLVFSANMIHRGLYGLDRLSLDILFCDNNPELLKHSNIECYPGEEEIKTIGNGYVFSNALGLWHF